MKRNIVFLKSKKQLFKIEAALKLETGPFLEVGPGKGAITEVIPRNRILIEKNLNFKSYLQNEFVIWEDILKIDSLFFSPEVLISNLPFDLGIRILVHCLKKFSSIKFFYVLLPSEIVKKFKDYSKPLAHKINHLFEVKVLSTVSKDCFQPQTVEAKFIKLTRKTIDWSFINFLNTINTPKKVLKKFFNNEASLKNTRLNDYNAETFYEIYKRLNKS